MSSLQEYRGVPISLITRIDVRYTGILESISQENSTISLVNVRSHGTENRRTNSNEIVLPTDEVYNYICFAASDILDLTVLSDANVTPQPPSPQFQDPAIISMRQQQQQQQQQKNVQYQQQQQAQVNEAYQSRKTENEPSLSSDYRVGSNTNLQDNHVYNVLPFDKINIDNENKKNIVNSNRDDEKNKYYSSGNRHHNNEGNNFFRGRGGRPYHPSRPLVVPKEAFDFDQANSKLDKSDVRTELLSIGVHVSGLKVGSSTENDKDYEENHEEQKDTRIFPQKQDFYDQTTSFYDNISCEALEREKNPRGSQVRLQRGEERKLNYETFGTSFVPNRGYWRGNMRGRNVMGRGGSRYSRGGGSYSHDNRNDGNNNTGQNRGGGNNWNQHRSDGDNSRHNNRFKDNEDRGNNAESLNQGNNYGFARTGFGRGNNGANYNRGGRGGDGGWGRFYRNSNGNINNF